MERKTIIGIDSGAKGGIAVFYLNGSKITDIKTFPYSTQTLAELGHKGVINKRSKIVIEKVHALPRQSITAMFNFGKIYGEIFGCLAGLGIDNIELVEPRKWKQHYNLIFGSKIDKRIKKQASINKAHEIAKEILGKDINLKRTERCKTDHDGMAEALLIGNYGR